MGKKILVISQYFYPEQFRINDICEQWVKRGYNVTVVTGVPNYPNGKFYDEYGLFKKRFEEHNGINIIRIPIIPRGKTSIQLALNYFSFVVSGYIWGTFSKETPDLVFNYETSPILQALPAVWFSKRRGVPCYVYILDMWPQSLEVVTGIKNQLIIKPLQKICDYIYKNCDRIFTSSETFISLIEERQISREKLTFWPQYAEDFYKPLKVEHSKMTQIPNDEKFNIIFAGNIGYAQGLGVLPKTAVLLKANQVNVRFCIIGDGRYKDKLINEINDNKVEDYFLFIDKQPAERIPDFMAACDAALVCLADNQLFAMTIPAKIQSCMACGIPIILSANGEAQQIIQNANCGVYCDAGDERELFDSIINITNKSKDSLEQMGKNALKYFKNNYEREILLNKMDKYLNL
ncbi:MAG: glycosyltransferase family 4 protein [Oscillospiraceae bacterium]